MDWIIISRIKATLAPWEQRTGLDIAVTMDGEMIITAAKVERHGENVRVYGRHGLVTETSDVKAWYEATLTDIRRDLSKADIKALWKAQKIASMQPYS